MAAFQAPAISSKVGSRYSSFQSFIIFRIYWKNPQIVKKCENNTFHKLNHTEL